jgi:hypothetical protein
MGGRHTVQPSINDETKRFISIVAGGTTHAAQLASMAIPPECLVIVRRGETEVFERLKAQFAGEPNVRVIWDRRVRDRRVIIQDVENERRCGERRAPLDATMWTARGYSLAPPHPAPAGTAAAPAVRKANGQRARKRGPAD